MERIPAEVDINKDNDKEAVMQDNKAKRQMKAALRKTKSLRESSTERKARFSDSKSPGVRLVWRNSSTSELENLGKVLGITGPSQRTRSQSPRARQSVNVDQVFSEYYDPLSFQIRDSNDNENPGSLGNLASSTTREHDIKSASSPELRDKYRRDDSKFKGIEMPSVKSLKSIFENVRENVDQQTKRTPRRSVTIAGHELSTVQDERKQLLNVNRKDSLPASSNSNLNVEVSSQSEVKRMQLLIDARKDRFPASSNSNLIVVVSSTKSEVYRNQLLNDARKDSVPASSESPINVEVSTPSEVKRMQLLIDTRKDTVQASSNSTVNVKVSTQSEVKLPFAVSEISDQVESMPITSNTEKEANKLPESVNDIGNISQKLTNATELYEHAEPHAGGKSAETETHVSSLTSANNIKKETISTHELDRNDGELSNITGTVQSLKKKWESLMILNSVTSNIQTKSMQNRRLLRKGVPQKETDSVQMAKSRHFDISNSVSGELEENDTKQAATKSTATAAEKNDSASQTKTDESIPAFPPIVEDFHKVDRDLKIKQNENDLNQQHKHAFGVQSTLHYSVKDMKKLYENKGDQDRTKNALPLGNFQLNSSSLPLSSASSAKVHQQPKIFREGIKKNSSFDTVQDPSSTGQAIMISIEKDKANAGPKTSQEIAWYKEVARNVSKEGEPKQKNTSKMPEAKDEFQLQSSNDTAKEIISTKRVVTEQEHKSADTVTAMRSDLPMNVELNAVKIELNGPEIGVNKIENSETSAQDGKSADDTNRSTMEGLIREFVKSEIGNYYLEVPKDESFSPTATSILESEHPPNMSHLMQANDTFRYPDLHENVKEESSTRSQQDQESSMSAKAPENHTPVNVVHEHTEKPSKAPKLSPKMRSFSRELKDDELKFFKYLNESVTESKTEEIPTQSQTNQESVKSAKTQDLPVTVAKESTAKPVKALKPSSSMRSLSRDLKGDELKFFRDSPSSKSFQSTNGRQVHRRERSSTIESSSPTSRPTVTSEVKPASELGSSLGSSFRKCRTLHRDELKFFEMKKSPKSASDVSLRKDVLAKVLRSKSIDGRKE